MRLQNWLTPKSQTLDEREEYSQPLFSSLWLPVLLGTLSLAGLLAFQSQIPARMALKSGCAAPRLYNFSKIGCLAWKAIQPLIEKLQAICSLARPCLNSPKENHILLHRRY